MTMTSSFNITDLDFISVGDFKKHITYEKKTAINILKETLSNFSSCRLKVLDDTFNEELLSPQSSIQMIRSYDIVFGIEVIGDHNGYNASTVGSFFQNELEPAIAESIDSGSLHRAMLDIISHLPTFPEIERDFFISTHHVGEQNGLFRTLHVESPNPYSAFCRHGCALFFSSLSDPLELVECTDLCDETYQYNITVGYNDLAEIARLECRDGCQMALIRCEPGYFCSQVELKNNISDVNTNVDGSRVLNYEKGFKAHCPSGTYRYDEAVDSCIPCPPGRFREDIKGRSLESCSKCPAGTYNRFNGSASILDCLRCPAGTFTNEAGSETCICITPDSCAETQLPSPADAEKRDTVPYIGFW